MEPVRVRVKCLRVRFTGSLSRNKIPTTFCLFETQRTISSFNYLVTKQRESGHNISVSEKVTLPLNLHYITVRPVFSNPSEPIGLRYNITRLGRPLVGVHQETRRGSRDREEETHGADPFQSLSGKTVYSGPHDGSTNRRTQSSRPTSDVWETQGPLLTLRSICREDKGPPVIPLLPKIQK